MKSLENYLSKLNMEFLSVICGRFDNILYNYIAYKFVYLRL